MIFADITLPEGESSTRIKAVDFGCPNGSYIYYTREKHGDEKHSYIYFAADESSADIMKALALDFAIAINCKYEGTEYHS